MGSTRLLHVTTIPATLHFLEGQPRYMAAAGMEVHVVSSAGDDLDRFVEKEPGVTAHVVPMRRDPAPIQDLVALARMIRCLRGIRPDIVHTHTPKAGLLAVVAARLAGVPLVIHHIHGGVWLAATGTRLLIARLTDRITCALAHRVLCVSNSVRDELVRQGLCAAAKVEVPGGGSINGVDAEGRFNPARLPPGTRRDARRGLGIPSDATVIGFVGRLTREKGLLELTQVWLRLRERYPALHLVLVGPHDDVTPLPPATQTALGADERIHLTGMDWNTPPYYAAMDVLVLPTYREGFPVVLLEAAAMALPIVATAVPGCTDAVEPGQTGTLVPLADLHALETALDRYISDPALRGRHGAAGRDRVLRLFTRERIWRRLLEVYRTTLRAEIRAEENRTR